MMNFIKASKYLIDLLERNYKIKNKLIQKNKLIIYCTIFSKNFCFILNESKSTKVLYLYDPTKFTEKEVFTENDIKKEVIEIIKRIVYDISIYHNSTLYKFSDGIDRRITKSCYITEIKDNKVECTFNYYMPDLMWSISNNLIFKSVHKVLIKTLIQDKEHIKQMLKDKDINNIQVIDKPYFVYDGNRIRDIVLKLKIIGDFIT